MSSISEAFSQAALSGRCLLVPELVLGFPDPRTSLKALEYLESLEHVVVRVLLPLTPAAASAVSPRMARVHQVALESGWSADRIVGRLGLCRPNFVVAHTRSLPMSTEAFVDSSAGLVDSILLMDSVPVFDGTVSEVDLACSRFGETSRRYDIDFVRLCCLAHSDRFEDQINKTQGFIYLTGIQSEEAQSATLTEALASAARRLRSLRKLPVLAGVGVNSFETLAAHVRAGVNGVTVTDWLVRDLAHGFAHFKNTIDQMIDRLWVGQH